MTKRPRPNLVNLRALVANQRALGRRLVWLLVVPFAITAIIVPMFFTLNARLKDVEVGAKLVTIERFLDQDRNYAWAADQYESLAKFSPSAAILARLGILYFLLDPDANENKAIQQLESAKQYDPKYWEIYRSLTYIYTKKRRVKEAIQAGEMAIKLNELDANSLNNLAWIYATCESKFRDLNKALVYAKRAIDLTEGKNPQFLDTLAQVYDKRGEHDLAREFLRQAISIAPNEQLQALKDRFKELFPNEALAESKGARQ